MKGLFGSKVDADVTPKVKLLEMLLVGLILIQSAMLVRHSLRCSPAQDELGQLTASIATARTGEPGFYRVNPPLPKVLSGLAVIAARDVPEMPLVMPSYMAPGNRSPEATMPRQYIGNRLEDYRWDFRVGRLARVLVIVLVTVGVVWWWRIQGRAGWLRTRFHTSLFELQASKGPSPATPLPEAGRGEPVREEIRSTEAGRGEPGEANGRATEADEEAGFSDHGTLSLLLFSTLWCTSPLMLGHGWTVMPDALSGAAMLVLLACSLAWLRARTWESWLFVGIAWGIAISTKFTFCPVYLLWPIGLILFQIVRDGFSYRELTKLMLAHVAQGGVALVVVWTAYNFSDIGVSFSQHSFASDRMQGLFDHDVIRDLPSPFPKQFLVGIDEQQLDLERGYPTYVLGKWYPDGVWWYYLFGLAAKESMAFWITGLLMPLGCIRLLRAGNREALSTILLSLISSLSVILVLSFNYKMGLNVRYAIPALPGLYLAMAVAVGGAGQGRRPLTPNPSPRSGARGASVSLGSSNRRGARGARVKDMYRGGGEVRRARVIVGVLCTVAVAETLWVFPNHFAYINPLVGGMYRVPAVLHDSNFDGGQDAWRMERWFEQHPIDQNEAYTVIQSKIPQGGLNIPDRPPTADVIRQLIQSRTDPRHKWTGPATTLVVSRGFEAPAPWTSRFGRRRDFDPAISDLLRLPPDEFVTPTIAIYRGGVGGER